MLAITEGRLGAYRERPIAESVAQAEKLREGYRAHAMDLAAVEQQQPLVDLAQAGIAGRNHYAHAQNPPYHQAIPGAIDGLYLREDLARRLADVNAVLAPYGLELWVFDAWRPIAVQNYFFDHWMPDYLRTAHPGLAGEALQREVEKYWARGAAGGVDPLSPPPHNTGAAVDLTLRYKGGAELFMGTIFDDVTALSNTAHFETADEMCFSHQEAKANRRMLYWLMQDYGFANNPTEWWHFSRGDQMWARLTGERAAHYASTTPPSHDL